MMRTMQLAVVCVAVLAAAVGQTNAGPIYVSNLSNAALGVSSSVGDGGGARWVAQGFTTVVPVR